MDGLTDAENMVYVDNRMLFSLKKRISCYMYEPGGHFTK